MKKSEFAPIFSRRLFSHKLNPRAALILGYADNARGNQEYPLARSARTIFMKIGYSWQM